MGYICHKLLILVILVHSRVYPTWPKRPNRRAACHPPRPLRPAARRSNGTAASGMVPEMVSFKWFINLLMMIIWFQPLWKTWKSVGMIVPYIYIYVYIYIYGNIKKTCSKPQPDENMAFQAGPGFKFNDGLTKVQVFQSFLQVNTETLEFVCHILACHVK